MVEEANSDKTIQSVCVWCGWMVEKEMLDCGKKMVWYKDGLVKFRHKEVTEF